VQLLFLRFGVRRAPPIIFPLFAPSSCISRVFSSFSPVGSLGRFLPMTVLESMRTPPPILKMTRLFISFFSSRQRCTGSHSYVFAGISPTPMTSFETATPSGSSVPLLAALTCAPFPAMALQYHLLFFFCPLQNPSSFYI